MPTISKVLAVLCVHNINILNSMHPIKSWTSYNTLPVGISGAMTAYNATSEMITILSPNAPYGRAYMNFYIDSLTFEMLNYPHGYRGEIDLQLTNDFVTIGNEMYFVNIFPWNNLNSFSLSSSSFTALNWSLPNGGYSENPCVSKSNDNKYIFILGGTNNYASYDQYFDTFYIYDLQNNILKGQGTNLPFPASNFGCFVSANDYLYIIGGEFMPNISKPIEKIQSNEIWSLYIADIDNLHNEKWILSSNTLPYSPQHPFVTEINDLIYIIGGWDINQQKCSNETNYMLFDGQNTFSIIPGPLLPNALCYTAGVTANYEIYLFGGQTSQDNHGELIKPSIWIKSNYLGPPTLSPTNPTLSPTNAPTQSPTQSPTRSPTHSPTKPTNAPSDSPTHSPTHSPTKSTLSPTQSPTKSPTHSPTDSPTNSPTQPTLSPSHSPTQNEHVKTKHSTEYWVFMAVAIGVCVLILCTASIWLYKKYQRDREKRLIYANDRLSQSDHVERM